MSVRPRLGAEVPELTARVARASNPAGTTAMWVRERLDGLWADEDFAGSGIEGTICELARGHGMRHCRYRGQPKARLQHVLTAIAVSIKRLSQLPPVRAHLRGRRWPSRSTLASTTSSACAPGEPSAKPQRPRFPTESS
jgi:DDE family transposase